MGDHSLRPRIARVVAVGIPHHVNQRGNRRQPTFFCEEEYRWSSAAAHLAGRDDFLVRVAPLHRLEANWESFLSEAPDEEEVRLLKKYKPTGRPLGNPSFVGRLEEILVAPSARSPLVRRRRNEQEGEGSVR